MNQGGAIVFLTCVSVRRSYSFGMSNRYYDGKHLAPRADISVDDVRRLRARAAELGLAVPATEKRGTTDQNSAAPRRKYVHGKVPTASPTRVQTPLPVVITTPGVGAITTPHALAISQLDLDAIRPGAWWRSLKRGLSSLFK